MAETAAHLVEEVIPEVPVRQWVLSLPIPLRYLLASHPQLLSPVLNVVHRAVTGFLLKKADIKRTEGQSGGVTFVQRFGSALNLNIHLMCMDAQMPRAQGCAGAEPLFGAGWYLLSLR